ncbi:MAG: hypothetical protein FWF81_05135 [Defluviitaleaceae bacterium]|nr:hypothetical protein [Defluviitaleaceae bacterium]
MQNNEITKQDIFFANTYFLTLALTFAVVVFSLFYVESVIFYVPFIVGGVGSLIFYAVLRKKDGLKIKSRIVCHALCSTVYIVGAFFMLVFYELDFLTSWSYHVWIVSVLIGAFIKFKHNVLIFALLFGIFIILFVLDIGGLFGAVMRAMAIGGFWGFAFYILLGFWSDIKTIVGGLCNDIT